MLSLQCIHSDLYSKQTFFWTPPFRWDVSGALFCIGVHAEGAAGGFAGATPNPWGLKRSDFFFWLLGCWCEDKVSCGCCDVLQDNAESKCPTQDFAKVKFLWFQYLWWSHISTKYLSLKRAVQSPPKFSMLAREIKKAHNISGCPQKRSRTS